MRKDRVLLVLKLAAEVDQPTQLNGFDFANLAKDAEQHVHYEYCVICKIAGLSIECNLEEHHVAGRVNFPDTITVCSRCHNHLSDHQKYWLLRRNNKEFRLSAYIFGWADVFDLLHEKTTSPYFLGLARKFRSQGWHIRNKLRERRKAVSARRIAM